MSHRPTYKTKLCNLFARGRCDRAACTFAHGEDDLRQPRFSSGNQSSPRYHHSPERHGRFHYPPPSRKRGRSRTPEGSHGSYSSQSHGSRSPSPSAGSEERVRERGYKQYRAPEMSVAAEATAGNEWEKLEDERRGLAKDIAVKQEHLDTLQTLLDRKKELAEELSLHASFLEKEIKEKEDQGKTVSLQLQKLLTAQQHVYDTQADLTRLKYGLQVLISEIDPDDIAQDSTILLEKVGRNLVPGVEGSFLLPPAVDLPPPRLGPETKPAHLLGGQAVRAQKPTSDAEVTACADNVTKSYRMSTVQVGNSVLQKTSPENNNENSRADPRRSCVDTEEGSLISAARKRLREAELESLQIGPLHGRRESPAKDRGRPEYRRSSYESRSPEGDRDREDRRWNHKSDRRGSPARPSPQQEAEDLFPRERRFRRKPDYPHHEPHSERSRHTSKEDTEAVTGSDQRKSIPHSKDDRRMPSPATSIQDSVLRQDGTSKGRELPAFLMQSSVRPASSRKAQPSLLKKHQQQVQEQLEQMHQVKQEEDRQRATMLNQLSTGDGAEATGDRLTAEDQLPSSLDPKEDLEKEQEEKNQSDQTTVAPKESIKLTIGRGRIVQPNRLLKPQQQLQTPGAMKASPSASEKPADTPVEASNAKQDKSSTSGTLKAETQDVDEYAPVLAEGAPPSGVAPVDLGEQLAGTGGAKATQATAAVGGIPEASIGGSHEQAKGSMEYTYHLKHEDRTAGDPVALQYPAPPVDPYAQGAFSSSGYGTSDQQAYLAHYPNQYVQDSAYMQPDVVNVAPGYSYGEMVHADAATMPLSAQDSEPCPPGMDNDDDGPPGEDMGMRPPSSKDIFGEAEVVCGKALHYSAEFYHSCVVDVAPLDLAADSGYLHPLSVEM